MKFTSIATACMFASTTAVMDHDELVAKHRDVVTKAISDMGGDYLGMMIVPADDGNSSDNSTRDAERSAFFLSQVAYENKTCIDRNILAEVVTVFDRRCQRADAASFQLSCEESELPTHIHLWLLCLHSALLPSLIFFCHIDTSAPLGHFC